MDSYGLKRKGSCPTFTKSLAQESRATKVRKLKFSSKISISALPIASLSGNVASNQIEN